MATQNPRGDGSIVTLSVQPSDEPFVRRLIAAASDGLAEELARFGGKLRVPADQLREEARSYRALLDGLDGAAIRPDRAMCEALSSLAEAVDRENQYSRVVAEHEAMYSLLGQLQRAVA